MSAPSYSQTCTVHPLLHLLSFGHNEGHFLVITELDLLARHRVHPHRMVLYVVVVEKGPHFTAEGAGRVLVEGDRWQRAERRLLLLFWCLLFGRCVRAVCSAGAVKVLHDRGKASNPTYREEEGLVVCASLS